MTTFVDFVIKSGTTKLTTVKQAKKAYSFAYDPARDWWKRLRDAIIEMHQKNKNVKILDSILMIQKPLKQSSYSKSIYGYKKWVGKKKIEWIGIDNSHWEYGDLTVRVNPELGLKIDGTNYMLKLYFKGEAPSKKD